MTNQTIEYNNQNESVRLKLQQFIREKEVKQIFFSKKCNLSPCTISLFLNKKRMLTDAHLDIIRDLIK